MGGREPMVIGLSIDCAGRVVKALSHLFPRIKVSLAARRRKSAILYRMAERVPRQHSAYFFTGHGGKTVL